LSILWGFAQAKTQYHLSGPADYKWFVRNSMHRYLSQTVVNYEDKFSDPENVQKLMRESPKNFIELGDDCQAERHHCDLATAMY
jgi:hypothetical protein